jgi:hypothetical protein
MLKEFKKVIDIAGAALESEDKYFQAAISNNQLAYHGKRCGILWLENERYYQYIITRSLTQTFCYPVQPEVNSHDLVIFYPDFQKWFAVIEMKKWLSPGGVLEIPGIMRDIHDKLRMTTKGTHSMMMIFSANDPGLTVEYIGDLAVKVGITCYHYYTFPTINRDNKQKEFWVAGYQVM